MRIKSLAVSGIALLALSGALAGCKDSGSDTTATQATSAAAPAPTASTPADNGVAALSADEIVTKSKDALKSAKSFQAKGDATENGQKFGLDMKISGEDVLGKLTVGTATVELLRVGGKQYMKPNAAFWTKMAGLTAAQTKAVTAKIGNKWVAVTKSNSGLSGFFDAVNVDDILKPEGTVSKGGAKQIGDYPTIAVKDSKGGSLYVATTGEPYPIQIDGDGTFAFSNFGETFADLKAPAAAEVATL